MSDLSTSDKMKLEKIFGMGSGYVLDFSNRTFGEFILENVGIDIFLSKYDYMSGSKANRLRAFWQKEGNIIVGKLLGEILNYWKLQKDLNNQLITLSEKALFDDCILIAERLTQNKPNQNQKDSELRKKKEQDGQKEHQLNLLLNMFD